MWSFEAITSPLEHAEERHMRRALLSFLLIGCSGTLLAQGEVEPPMTNDRAADQEGSRSEYRPRAR